MSSALDDALPLSDDLFLLAHCERSGRPRLHQLVSGAALSGGLLGELALSGHLQVADGRVRPRNRRPPDDRTCHRLFDVLLSQPHQELGCWISLLSRSATQTVAARLIGAGIVVPTRFRKGLFGHGIAYRPVDSTGAYWRMVRLSRALDGSQPLNPRDTLLAGLVEACGLLPAATDGEVDLRALRRIEQALAQAGHGTNELIDAVRLAVGDAVLRART